MTVILRNNETGTSLPYSSLLAALSSVSAIANWSIFSKSRELLACGSYGEIEFPRSNPN